MRIVLFVWDWTAEENLRNRRDYFLPSYHGSICTNYRQWDMSHVDFSHGAFSLKIYCSVWQWVYDFSINYQLSCAEAWMQPNSDLKATVSDATKENIKRQLVSEGLIARDLSERNWKKEELNYTNNKRKDCPNDGKVNVWVSFGRVQRIKPPLIGHVPRKGRL